MRMSWAHMLGNSYGQLSSERFVGFVRTFFNIHGKKACVMVADSNGTPSQQV
jgi:hypothetical protein